MRRNKDKTFTHRYRRKTNWGKNTPFFLNAHIFVHTKNKEIINKYTDTHSF